MKALAATRYFLAFATAALAVPSVCAQTLDKATLRVTVLGSAGSLRADTVLLIQGPRQVLTVRIPPASSQGYSVPNLEPGPYALAATSGDLCTAAMVSVYVSAGQTTRASVRLSPCASGSANCELPGAVKALVAATSGPYRATGSQGGFLQLCRPQGSSILLRGHSATKPVTALAFSHDSRFLASGSDDDTVIVWDVATGRQVRRFDQGHELVHVVFSGDGRYLASADDNGTVKVWDVTQGRNVATGAASGKIDSLQFAPDASFVVVSSGKQQQFVQVRPAARP
jgi:WD domain, G-beta repeat